MMKVLNLCLSTYTVHVKQACRLQLLAVREEVYHLKQVTLAKGERLNQTTLFYMLKPFYWEGTTPSAQQFLLLEAEITHGKTYCVSAKSLWECREAHPVASRGRTTILTPKISSCVIAPTRIFPDIILSMGFLPCFPRWSNQHRSGSGFSVIMYVNNHDNTFITVNVHSGSLNLAGS